MIDLAELMARAMREREQDESAEPSPYVEEFKDEQRFLPGVADLPPIMRQLV